MAIFLITAPSGSGKTSITHQLKSRGVWEECISHTTRQMRDGEIDGETYYYVSKEKFEKMLNNDEFAENVSYHGQLYAISKREINKKLEICKHIFIIVEHDGYKQIKAVYPNAVGIFLHMTKEDCVENMLLRGDKSSSIEARISTYEEEMLNRHSYDYVIKNVKNKASETANIVESIVEQYN